MPLLFVALGSIILWFLIAPFLKPVPGLQPEEVDPRVTCVLCDELKQPEDVLDKEFKQGRYHFICGSCIVELAHEFEEAHGRPPRAEPISDPE